MGLKENSDFIHLNAELRRHLRTEMKRTHLTALALFRDDPALPDGLNVSSINRWMTGIIKQAPQSHLDYVLNTLARQPDGAGRIAGDGSPPPRPGKRHARAGQVRIAVTDEMSAHIRAEFARTGLDAASVLANDVDVPEGLNARIVKGWLYRDAATTDAAHWEFVTARLAAAPHFQGLLPPLTRSRK